MKTNINSMLKPALLYASIIAGVAILNNVIVDLMNIHFSTYNFISSFILVYGGLFLAILYFRKEYNNDLLSFNQGLIFGLMVSFFAGIILLIWQFVFVKYVNPDYQDIAIRFSQERLINKGVPDEFIEKQTERMLKGFEPLRMVIRSVLSSLIVGLIFSLIFAAILKKESATPFQEVEDDE